MRSAHCPKTLRLPFAMVDQPVRLEQVLTADRRRSWAQGRLLFPCFALSRPEKQFVRHLLERKRNVWLFRCNQRHFCGDFIAVDMSAVRLRYRSAVVLELKSGAAVRLGGAGAGNQLQRTGAALRELLDRGGIIAGNSRVVLASGDGELLLEWMETKWLADRGKRLVAELVEGRD